MKSHFYRIFVLLLFSLIFIALFLVSVLIASPAVVPEGDGVYRFSSANAVTYHVRDGGTSTTCADWANACDTLPSTLERGATYYVAKGSYPGRTFNTPESGTSVITIKGATAADHGTDAGWNIGYSVNVSDGGNQAIWTSGITFNTSYWVFDGSVGPLSKIPSQFGFAFSQGTGNVRRVQIYNTGSVIRNITVSHIAALAPAGDFEKFFLATNDSTQSVHNVL